MTVEHRWCVAKTPTVWTFLKGKPGLLRRMWYRLRQWPCFVYQFEQHPPLGGSSDVRYMIGGETNRDATQGEWSFGAS